MRLLKTLTYFQLAANMLILMVGCTNEWNTNAYRKAIHSGRKVLGTAIEMETQFSNTEHILIMYGATGRNEHEWQTVSFFGGRYELTMSVIVVLSANGEIVTKASNEPTFVLTVCKSINPTGGASLNGSREQKFGIDKWEAFKASGYDLKLLDPAYDGSVLAGFEQYANEWQESRRIWR